MTRKLTPFFIPPETVYDPKEAEKRRKDYYDRRLQALLGRNFDMKRPAHEKKADAIARAKRDHDEFMAAIERAFQ